eukprot:6771551-Pyramimonas_sp.AAC.1
MEGGGGSSSSSDGPGCSTGRARARTSETTGTTGTGTAGPCGTSPSPTPSSWLVHASFVGYNAYTLMRTGRTESLGLEFARASAIFVPGTKIPMKLNQQHHYERTPEFHWIHWGWGRGSNTNASAGVSIAVSAKLYQPRHIIRITYPPPHLQGRAGCVDIERGPQRFRLIVGYYPPRCSSARRAPCWRATCKQLTSWIKQQADSVPARVLPIIFADLNLKM